MHAKYSSTVFGQQNNSDNRIVWSTEYIWLTNQIPNINIRNTTNINYLADIFVSSEYPTIRLQP